MTLAKLLQDPGDWGLLALALGVLIMAVVVVNSGPRRGK